MTFKVVKRYPEHFAEQLPADWPATIRQILAHRGVTRPEQLDLRLQGMAHFSQLRGIDAACEAMLEAREHNEAIVICGDFDADGATSTALLMSALPQLGFTKVTYRVPNRMTEGYGLSAAIVEQLAEQQVGLILTVDNGIAAHDA
ncbi:DHH family phosphoesterase, partial [Idiomarina sp.]|uniref:DHH family phosphoesterase n=1 Tax=Idiomarina sp. TaxID=1874361 RepID=UPI002585476A